MTFELSRRVLIFWRFTAACVFAAVFAGVNILPVFRNTVKICASAGLAALFFVTVFLYLPLLYKAEKIEITKDAILCRKGVVIKREYVYPNTRLVYLQKFRLPISSCFGLCTVVLRTTGGGLLLPPLTDSQAKTLRKTAGLYE